jgi:hypothetical protein
MGLFGANPLSTIATMRFPVWSLPAMNQRTSKYTVASAIAMLIWLLAGRVAYAEWGVVPSVELRALTEENPRLRPDTLVVTQENSSSAIFQGSLDLGTFTERGSLRFEPSFISYRYSDEADKDLESDDPYFNGSGEYRWEKLTAGFTTRYARERLRSAEIVSVEPDNDPDTVDPDFGDTGRLLFINEDRERYYVQPYVTVQVSERNSFRIDVTDYQTDFSGGDLSFRTGFSDTIVTASLIREVSERNSVSAIMSYDSFEANVNNNNYDTATIEGAFTRPLTELWTFTLAAGVFRSDFTVIDSLGRPDDGATTDYKARIGFRKRAERSRLNLDIARNVYPSGSSYNTIRREIRFYVDRDMTQRLIANFGILVQESKSLGDINSIDDRDYANVGIGFQWAIKPVLFLTAGAEYYAQEFTEDLLGERTNSTSIYVGIGYRGRSRR